MGGDNPSIRQNGLVEWLRRVDAGMGRDEGAKDYPGERVMVTSVGLRLNWQRGWR